MFVKLIKARTCEGCKAKIEDWNPLRNSCQLADFECTTDGKPLNPCPKPKTLAMFSDIGIAGSRGQVIYSKKV
jgi:hypothetical protein